MNIPYFLDSKCADLRSGICYGCSDAVKENKATGRFFITMGHPGFNSPANNADGYASAASASAALIRYARRSRKSAAVAAQIEAYEAMTPGSAGRSRRLPPLSVTTKDGWTITVS